MGLKTVRVCDVTGEELVSPFNIGFNVEGRNVKLEVSQKVAQQFVFALAGRLHPDALAEVVAEVFGKDWDKHEHTG